MRRKVFAAAWIAGATLPLLLAAVFVFGCCTLPFHGVIHKVMPLCELAMSVMRGDDHHHDPATPPVKPDPVKRLSGEAPLSFHLFADAAPQRFDPLTPNGFRSFITHGAVRCDQDVGLHLFVETLRI